MENLLLWFVSTATYFVVYLCYGHYNGTALLDSISLGKNMKYLAVIALLALPVNNNGHVFTVFGNAVGEKGVYSIAPFYQKSDGDVVAVLAPLTYQESSKGNAFAIVGIPSYQSAKESTGLFVGIAPYQKSANGRPGVLFGIAGRQEGRSVFVGFGLGGYQKATIEAQSFLSLVFFQRVGEKTRSFAVFSTLSAD